MQRKLTYAKNPVESHNLIPIFAYELPCHDLATELRMRVGATKHPLLFPASCTDLQPYHAFLCRTYNLLGFCTTQVYIHSGYLFAYRALGNVSA